MKEGGAHPRRLGRLWVALALLPALGGCFLPDSYHAPADPVAVRERDGRLEILYTSCDPLKIQQIRVVDPRDETVVKDDDPVVWQVRFEPPTDRKQFTIGQALPGGTEQVALSGPLGEKTYYVVWVDLADGRRLSGSFQRAQLASGKVDHGGELLSPEDFVRQSPCTANPS